jgi:hypothetical protein
MMFGNGVFEGSENKISCSHVEYGAPLEVSVFNQTEKWGRSVMFLYDELCANITERRSRDRNSPELLCVAGLHRHHAEVEENLPKRPQPQQLAPAK